MATKKTKPDVKINKPKKAKPAKPKTPSKADAAKKARAKNLDGLRKQSVKKEKPYQFTFDTRRKDGMSPSLGYKLDQLKRVVREAFGLDKQKDTKWKVELQGTLIRYGQTQERFRVTYIDVNEETASGEAGGGFQLGHDNRDALGALSAAAYYLEAIPLLPSRTYDEAKKNLIRLLLAPGSAAMCKLVLRLSYLLREKPDMPLRFMFFKAIDPPYKTNIAAVISHVVECIPKKDATAMVEGWIAGDKKIDADDAADLEKLKLRLPEGLKQFFMHVIQSEEDAGNEPILDRAKIRLENSDYRDNAIAPVEEVKGEKGEILKPACNTETMLADINLLIERWSPHYPLRNFITAADWVSKNESEELMKAAEAMRAEQATPIMQFCKRCDNLLDENGRCTDSDCPYKDYGQEYEPIPAIDCGVNPPPKAANQIGDDPAKVADPGD